MVSMSVFCCEPKTFFNYLVMTMNYSVTTVDNRTVGKCIVMRVTNMSLSLMSTGILRNLYSV